ncbi:non-ribosomal peptide synthetase [Streptomyces sp. NBC_00370]|uniref:non-ribosomal peptide synthetase n=1 Tax=Streptomyces sp. NBC_00370 TaxID=2975728 RepID=UPI002E26676F|nr:non-ribosomal peptide synthetase [Streptomyces sp. NBC_00370]
MTLTGLEPSKPQPVLRPLAGAQRTVWLAQQVNREPALYNVPFALRITGRLSLPGLRHALGELTRLHGELRSTVHTVDGEPYRAPVPQARIPLTLREVRDEDEARAVMAEESALPFEQADGPPLRVLLLRLAEDNHIVQFTGHHLAMDGWSVGVLVEDFAERYARYLRAGADQLPDGTPVDAPRTPEAPMDAAGVRVPSAEDEQEDLDFWEQALHHAPEGVELSLGGPRPAVRSFRGATAEHRVPRELADRIRDFSRRHRVSPATTLLAGFAVLLHRYTDRDDLVLGTSLAGRDDPATERLVSCLVRTVPLRLAVAPTDGFAAVLHGVRDAFADAMEHQDVAIERLAERLRIEHDPSRSPFFQLVFGYERDTPAPTVPGADLRRLPLSTPTAKFDLTWNVVDDGAQLRVEAEHSTDLFDAAAVRQLFEHWVRLLDACTAAPETPVGRAELLTPAERARLADRTPAITEPATAPQMFAGQVGARGGSVAVVDGGGGSLSYAGLDAWAEVVAGRLRGLGVGRGDRVGLCLGRGVGMVAAVLGVWRCGAAYVPVDPVYPRDRVAFVLKDAGVRVVLGEPGVFSELPVGEWEVVELREPPQLGEVERDGSTAGPVVEGPGPDDLAYVIYTSGSTGTPKGVEVSHGNLAALIEAGRRTADPGGGDVWTLFHSFAFDFSVWEIWGALAFGGRLVVVSDDTARDPGAFADLLVREQVTVLSQTPSAFRQLDAEDAARPRDGLRLRLVVFGGEALDAAAVRAWHRRHPAGSPLLVNMFGTTETTVHVTAVSLTEESLAPTSSPIGHAIPGWSVLVLDRFGNPVPPGVTGELCVGGAGVARGYLGRPGLTADRFVPDPYGGSGARLYRTGDLGRWLPNGILEYLGRADQQVKVRGFRIEPGEVEARLAEHAQVAACVVAAVGKGAERRLAGFVVPYRDAPDPSADDLRAWLAARLPAYMVPSLFVPLESLPTTPSGKTDRGALPALAGKVRAAAVSGYRPPRTDTERTLARIWAEVLHADRVGIDDDFFDLGGDSIRAVRISGTARESGVPVSIPDLYECRTVGALARRADETLAAQDGDGDSEGAVRECSAPFSLLTPEQRADVGADFGDDVVDAYPMTTLQLGMVYHMASDPERLPYHNAAGYRVPLRFDEESFRRALRAVVARHPVLRTALDPTAAPEPLQIVHREAEPVLAVTDLRGLPKTEQEEQIDRAVAAERRQPFDHLEPPLLRFAVHVCDDSAFHWTVVEHHAILDGWSLWSTLSEILAHYLGLLGGHAPAEEPPPASVFRDFVAAERRAVDSADAAQFWAETLADYDPLTLPAPPRPAAGTGRRDTHVPVRLSHQVEEFARGLGVPEKSVYLAAHLRVLAELTGRQDVCCGITLNGRLEETGGTDVRGLFLNTVPLRTRVGAESAAELVEQVFEAERRILPHRRTPLARIHQITGQHELFATNFVYNNFHVARETLGAEDAGLLADLGDLTAARRDEPADVPLTLTIFKNPLVGGVQLCMDYDTEYLAAEQADSVADRHLRELATLVGAEQHTVRPDLVAELFAGQVSARGGSVAVVDGEGTSLSYAGLDAWAEVVAGRLRRLGVGRGDRVALCLGRGVGMVAAVLGVWRCGAAYVPVDPAYPQDRVAFVLKDAGVRVVVRETSVFPELPMGEWEVVELREPPVPGEVQESDGSVQRSVAEAPGPDDLAYVIYTSGSTGTPKGVQVEHRSLDNLVDVVHQVMDLRPEDRLWQFASFGFDVSVGDMVAALTTGATLLVSPGGAHRVGDGLRESMQALSPTVLSLPPSVLAGLDPAELPQVRRVVVAGEALPPALAARWSPTAEVVNAYGPTEDTVYATSHLCDRAEEAPIGCAVPGTTAYVLDARGLPVPDGERGELCVGGAGVARGYLRRPGLTADRFVPDPFGERPGARLYRTGDLARRRPDGVLEYLGRADQQVKVHGQRIEPGEVEARLTEHPGVGACAVAAVGEGAERRLVGFVVPERDAPVPDPAELRARLGSQLPAYMVPTAFVPLDALPMTPSGKIDRAALPRLADAGPAAAPAVADAGHRPPRTDTERTLARIWAEVLKVDRVGIEDDFFDLGGDSIRAVQIAFRAQRELGLALKPVDVQIHPTVAELAGIAGTPQRS